MLRAKLKLAPVLLAMAGMMEVLTASSFAPMPAADDKPDAPSRDMLIHQQSSAG